LRVAEHGFERVAHLRTFRLPGGEQAVREPRRTALGLLYELLGDSLFARNDLAPLRGFSDEERRLLLAMLREGFNAPRTSSAGRLFDAVAALLDIRQTVAFEGQAAMQLEYAAHGAEAVGPYPFTVGDNGIIDWGPMVGSILEDMAHGSAIGTMARRFHDTLAEIIVAIARRVGEEIVVLAGGCFQNAYLLEKAAMRLRAAGFRVCWPERLPPNDGGIALGQIVAAVSGRRSLQ
jgi:hydrogenase maturation protein HypF